MMSKISENLKTVRHELVTLNGVKAFDGAAPQETFEIETNKAIKAIEELMNVYGQVGEMVEAYQARINELEEEVSSLMKGAEITEAEKELIQKLEERISYLMKADEVRRKNQEDLSMNLMSLGKEGAPQSIGSSL